MQLQPIQQNGATISSVEIAQLTGKTHDNVIRDIRKTLQDNGQDVLKFEGIYLDAYKREKPCYNLPRFECDLVVSGYSVKYRAAIIKRWHELEATPKLPQNLGEALRLAADTWEKLQEAETKLIEAAPKLQTYNEVMDSNGLHNFREVAGLLPHLKLGSNNLVKELVAKKVLYYDNEGKIRCYQPFTDSGYFKLIERPYEVKEAGGVGTGEYRVSATLKVTPSGVEFIGRKLKSA